MSVNEAGYSQLKELLAMTSELSDRFASRAHQIDEEGSFPEKNFEELKQTEYIILTIPEQYGGKEISLYEFVVLQERLAQGDASTALSIGWHLCVLLELSTSRSWEEGKFANLCREIVKNKYLINRAASERETGSPSRGGIPRTTAEKVGNSWTITGRKTYTSMSVALDYIIISANIKGTNQIAEFLINCNIDGLSYEKTWDTLGMRGTCSHDLILNNVLVSEDALVRIIDTNSGHRIGGWLLHIPACYLGIAIAARNYALKFASEYSPNSINEPIKNLYNVRNLIGQMEMEILTSRRLLHSVARDWDNEPRRRKELETEIAATKLIVTNNAISVVDKAMRLVGGHSLFRSLPLERYYRDVRAGLHNPPSDDITIQFLAKQALEKYE